MSDLLRFEIWQVFLLQNLCDVSLRMHKYVKIGVSLKNYWWGQMVTRAWIFLLCILAFHWTKDINFMLFSSNFSSSIFTSTSNGFSYLALINRFGKLKCATVEIYVIPCYERFVKIWNLARFLPENLCVFSFRMHEYVKIGVALKNYSWRQVVTRAWIFNGAFLLCIERGV